jgi:cytochrome b involved in lipid metabolism
MGNKASSAAAAPEGLDTSKLPVMTRDEVKGDSRKLLVIDEIVYDVTEFRDKHPGGGEILDDYIGDDASKDFSDAGHSRSAYDILVKLAVAKLA